MVADTVEGMDFNDSYVQGQSIKMPTGDGGLSVVFPPASAGKGEARVLVTEDDGEWTSLIADFRRSAYQPQ